MKTSFDHLSADKQQELRKVVKTIKSQANVEKIILFGSYARGDYVDSDVYQMDGITYEYRSDFDILIIVKNQKREQDYPLWRKLEELIARDKSIKTPVSVLVDNIETVNTQLSDGRYFMVDIQKEGIMLFDSKRHALLKPRKLTATEKKKFATEYYEMWMGKASEFLIDFHNALDRNSTNNAAFYLHQATESLLIGYLLVRTGYRPKTHDLEKLIGLVCEKDKRFQLVFSRSTQEENRLFRLLQRAYVDARYSKSYTITADELNCLHDKAKNLQALANCGCQEIIVTLSVAASC